jgi:hypothetical protein
MATTVFISYSHVYAAQVERVKRGLGAEGVRVWIDHESLQPGTRSWEIAIRQGIQASDVVVYLASPEALLSNNVQGELDVAESYHKPILPVWLAGDQWVHVVPMAMSKAQYIDARGPLLDAAIPRIAHSLNRIAATSSPTPSMYGRDESRPGLPSPSAGNMGSHPTWEEIAIPSLGTGTPPGCYLLALGHGWA